jgi:non-homologous end joining protein Ku/predicted HicB family RNase H-like nuclease
MNTVRYRDYQGAVEFDSGKLLVRILHIDDLITTEVDSASEVEAAFAELVEDYLASCAELGKEPNKPFKGLFNVRVPPDMHKQVAFAAASNDVTLNAYVIAALEDKLTPKIPLHDLSEGARKASVFEGFLRLSLVTCPVRLHPAAEEEHDLDLDEHTIIEIDHFVPKGEVDPLYVSNPYYLVPDGVVGHDAYAIIREAMAETKMVALASIGEHTMALEPRGAGMVATMLRNADQVRDPRDLFGSVQGVKLTKDMLDLATYIVKQKAEHFNPQKLKPAPKKRKKVAEEEPKLALSRSSGNVIDLMDALRQSMRRKSTSDHGDRRPSRKA